MQKAENLDMQRVARRVGWTLLLSILVGILTAMFITQGININLSADVVTTAENMLEAELRLKAKAYIGAFVFSLEALISVGLYLLLRKFGLLVASWSLFVSLGSSLLFLLGAIFAMNAAQIAHNVAYTQFTDEAGRRLLTSLQVTSDYTSFHLGIILSAASMAGFFYLFLKSGLIPKIISGWGLFASLFVVVTIVGRDFFPALGHTGLTTAFMVSNLIALVSTGLYLGIRGVRAI
ncbi:MAG: DUF4386 domain-containing protein [Parvularculaceae bacterium]